MTALAIALTALSAALLGALITVLAWYRSALADARRLDAERDLLVRDRDALAVTNSTLTDERDHERHLREVAEQQRNEAMAAVRTQVLPILKSAGVDDAIRIVDGLLSGGVLPKKDARGAGATADRDALLDPFVRPPR